MSSRVVISVGVSLVFSSVKDSYYFKYVKTIDRQLNKEQSNYSK